LAALTSRTSAFDAAPDPKLQCGSPKVDAATEVEARGGKIAHYRTRRRIKETRIRLAILRFALRRLKSQLN
jgi:hypothetical protein